ncbi:spore coat protein CotJB [Sellimonas intestinalis]|uniref:spore coat protein CotJB n=1 Tax=Sellimonas intestinalis TaxID=1653434 RepID=UPI000B0D26D1
MEIQKVSFVMDDLRLYLDTHPDDLDALAMLKRVHPRYLLQQSNFRPKEMQLRT